MRAASFLPSFCLDNIETSVDVCTFQGAEIHYAMRRCHAADFLPKRGPPIVPYVAVCDISKIVGPAGFNASAAGTMDECDGGGIYLQWDTPQDGVRHEPAFMLDDVYGLVEQAVCASNLAFDEGIDAPDLDKFRTFDWAGLKAAIRIDAHVRYTETLKFLQDLGNVVRDTKRKLSAHRSAYQFEPVAKRTRR